MPRFFLSETPSTITCISLFTTPFTGEKRERRNSWHISFDIDPKTHSYFRNINVWENMQYGKM